MANPFETIVSFDYDSRNAPDEAQVRTLNQLDTGPQDSTRVASWHGHKFSILYGDTHVQFRNFGETIVKEWTIQKD